MSDGEFDLLMEDGRQLEVDGDEGERQVGHHRIVLTLLDVVVHHVEEAHPI